MNHLDYKVLNHQAVSKLHLFLIKELQLCNQLALVILNNLVTKKNIPSINILLESHVHFLKVIILKDFLHQDYQHRYQEEF